MANSKAYIIELASSRMPGYEANIECSSTIVMK